MSLADRICIGEHERINEIYDKLMDKNSENKLIELRKAFKNNDKMTDNLMIVLEFNWNRYDDLRQIILRICKMLKKCGCSPELFKYVKFIDKELDKIKNAEDLYEFIEKLINRKNILKDTQDLFALLKDKDTCQKYLGE